eukprot:1192491-Prorocentrum_minimum.AAC.3
MPLRGPRSQSTDVTKCEARSRLIAFVIIPSKRRQWAIPRALSIHTSLRPRDVCKKCLDFV